MSAKSPSSSIPNLIGKTIDNGKLVFRRLIGHGAWGVVYLAGYTDHTTPSEVAVKVIHNAASTTSRHGEIIRRELDLHQRCSEASKGVLKVIKVIETPRLIYIVTEFCAGGDLLDAIADGKFVGKDRVAKEVILQILDALEACHEQGVYHRDLKPENILLKDHSSTIVLADFGFATSEAYIQDFRIGSEPFMSPEVLGGRDAQDLYPACQVDIWALGVVMMNLVCRRSLPWGKASLEDDGFETYTTRDQDHLFHKFPISSEFNDILKRIFCVDPYQRATIPEIRRHIEQLEWFGRPSLKSTAKRALWRKRPVQRFSEAYDPVCLVGTHRQVPRSHPRRDLYRPSSNSVDLPPSLMPDGGSAVTSASHGVGPTTPTRLTAAGANIPIFVVPTDDRGYDFLAPIQDSTTKMDNDLRLPAVTAASIGRRQERRLDARKDSRLGQSAKKIFNSAARVLGFARISR